MKTRFEIAGPGGDAGLAARAARPGALFARMAAGFYALSCGAALKPRKTRRLRLKAPDLGALLVNFLNELVFLLDARGFAAARTWARVKKNASGFQLEARLSGEEKVFERHPRGALVKAATYHGLVVGKKRGRWRAKVVLDI